MSVLIEQDREAELFQRGARRFLWAGFIATLLVVGAIMWRQGWFKETAEFYFVTDNAHDLSKGQQVKIAGFRVGAVQAVALQANGDVTVRLVVDADHLRFVTTESLVELRKEGLVGAAVLEIVPGNNANKGQPAKDGDKLSFTRADSLSAMAMELRNKINPVIDDVKTITGAVAHTLTDQQQGLPATLGQIRTLTSSLNTLVNTGNQQAGLVGESVRQTLDKTQGDLTRLGQTMDTVNQRLPGLLDRTQQVIEQTSGVIGHVEKIAAQAEVSVPPVLQNTDAIAADVREVVSGAKTTWPLRNIVDAPAPQQLKMDSEPALTGKAQSPKPAVNGGKP